RADRPCAEPGADDGPRLGIVRTEGGERQDRARRTDRERAQIGRLGRTAERRIAATLLCPPWFCTGLDHSAGAGGVTGGGGAERRRPWPRPRAVSREVAAVARNIVDG